MISVGKQNEIGTFVWLVIDCSAFLRVWCLGIFYDVVTVADWVRVIVEEAHFRRGWSGFYLTSCLEWSCSFLVEIRRHRAIIKFVQLALWRLEPH